MKHFTRLAALVLGSSFAMVACGGDDTSGGTGGTGGSTTTESGGAGGAGGGSGGSGTTTTETSTGGAGGGQGGAGGAICVSPEGDFDANGCLTFDSASKICGFDSDETVCELSFGCGSSDDVGQCKINCEMGTTVKCYKQADIDCLVQANCAQVCADLTACAWVL